MVCQNINCSKKAFGSAAVSFLCLLSVFVGTCQVVLAQKAISPTTSDPNYYIRKQTAAKKNAAANKVQPPGMNTSNIQNRTFDTVNCFIPRDTGYTVIPRTDDDSWGPIALPFNYNLYGVNYNKVYINNNGNLTFVNASTAYDPLGFPISVPMVAGFWADIDTRNPASGQVYYKVFSNKIIVTWDGVGYFSNGADKLNTFQIILTNGLDSTIGAGTNTAFYYKDMQWATGNSSGFGGTAATVGINRGNSVNYVQIGRFRLNSSVYDGPGGNDDGVNYLDNQCFKFNVTNTTNIPPSVSGLPVANPVTVNVGDTVKLNPQFIGPEVGQTVTTTVNTGSICRVTHIDSNGAVSKINLTFVADTCNVGTNVITFTATDNGTPVQSTIINYTIIVNKLNQSIAFPSLPDVVYGVTPFSLPATASSGLPITYTITGPASVSGNILTINGVGTVTVTASQPGSTAFNAAVSIGKSFCVRPGMPNVIAGDTVVCASTQTSYSVANVTGATFSWTLSGGGTITPNGNSALLQWTATPGTYTLTVKYTGNCGTSDSTRTLSVRVDNQLSGTFSNLLPANGATSLMLPVTFSWSPITNALGYDLYVWPDGAPRPSSPVAANIPQLSYTISDTALLQYETPYRWQVIARRNCYTLQSSQQTFTLRYSPDLVVDSISAPIEGFAGRTIHVSWKVKNAGRRTTTTPTWIDRVYVSASPVFVPGSALVQYEFGHSGNLLPGGTYHQSQDIVLPPNTNGQFYVYVFTDAALQLTEYNPGGEDNNIQRSGSITVNLKMPADLIVSQLTGPAKASAGQKANIQWTSKNQGDTALTASPWADRLYLSLSPTFSLNSAVFIGSYLHSGGLAANSEYSNSVLATIPTIPQGNYYVFAVTDADNQATEYDEGNNVRRSAATMQIGVPDLMPLNVSIPGAVSQGQPLKIQWTVKNTGSGATENAAWTERIFLSPSAIYTPNNAIWFDVQFPPITLNAGASISREINLNIPDIVSGRYYAFVYTDFTNAVYEDTSEYNNVSRSASYSDITTGVPVRDIGVSEILTPSPDCGLGANEGVKVKITNYGNLFHTGFNISYRINNGAVITENVGTATLLPGSTLFYTFTAKADLSQISAYNFKAYTSLPNDTLRTNDSITATITHFPPLDAPTNMLPADGSTNLNRPVNFSWRAVSHASRYDLFLWKATDPLPATPVATNLTQINFSFSSGLLYGTAYRWRVVAKSANCQTSSVTQEFTVRHLPDLIVDSIFVPVNGGTSESPFSVSWRTTNRGFGATGSVNWQETLYISESPTIRANDIFLANFQNVSALAANESYLHPLYTFTIPQGYQGTYYLVIKTNAYRNLEEVTDSNNIRVVPITITLAPPPDLQVDSLIVAPTTLFSEDTLNVSWIVRNIGTGPTTVSQWTDVVYLSTSDTLNPNTVTRLGTFPRSGALPVGASYAKAARFKLPSNIGGTYYIHVRTDATNAVYEYVHENNNVTTWSSINVIMRPNPNLVISAVTAASDTVSTNQTMLVQWTTKNEGAVPANPAWRDELRLTGDTANGHNNYRYLATYNQTNVLHSLSASGAQTTVRLPSNLVEGSYYFYAVADIYNNVFEGMEEADNVSRYSAPVYVVNPDLKPIALQAPPAAQSEEQLTLRWDVRNEGKGGVYNSSWSDAIYFSQDTVPSSDDVLLTSSSGNQLLSPGSQYAKQQTVTLPVGISGTYYLLLVTDDGRAVTEKNETNNRLYVPIAVTIAPWPDLRITSLQPPLIDTAGTAMTFSYSVQNAGRGRINNKAWNDVFYLSPSRNPADPGAFFFSTVSIAQRSLDTAESYTRSVTVQIPYAAIGRYYLVGKTDNGNNVFEHTDENNNQGASDTTISIAPSAFVDLAAVSGKVMADSLTPGQTVTVEWSGQNRGMGATRAVNWEDAIYLSNNPTLDATDRLLKAITVNKVVQPGASYTLNNTVTLPNDASGTLYFLINVDRTNQQGDTLRGNNTKVMEVVLRSGGQVVDSGGGVVIIPPLPSDLVPVSFQAPATGMSGQPVNVTYQVKNNRSGRTNANSWTDRVYLSTDYVLDGGDQMIGSFTHTGRLDSMGQYADSQQVFLPSQAQGNFVLLFKTDASDHVFELNAENNNIAFGTILIQPQQPCDLIVTHVEPPAGPQLAGQLVTIRYTLKNRGINPVQGWFRDAVYLSKDSAWDIDDVLLGTTDLAASNLFPQDTLARQLTKRLLNVAAGEYYVIVRTDILNNLLEANEANNTLSSVSLLTVDVKLLTMGVTASDTLKNGELLYYRINISQAQEGETMLLSLQGDSVRRAINRLYLKYAAAPAANSADFVSEIPFSANQEIVVPALKAGTYYIMASGNDTATALQPITLLARIIPFEITKVDAKKGGNTGAVTIKINGAKFDSSTSFKLRGTGGSISPARIYYTNSTQVFATFDLLNAALGQYTVVATKANNDSAQLLNGFEIEKGVGSTAGNGGGGSPGSGTGFVCQVVNIGFEDQLETGYEYPPSTRALRLVSITIFYANRGNVDIPAPTRFFYSLQNNVPLALTPGDIALTQTGPAPPPGSVPSSIGFDFNEPGSPPGILRPGAVGYKKVYTIAYESNIGTLDFVISK